MLYQTKQTLKPTLLEEKRTFYSDKSSIPQANLWIINCTCTQQKCLKIYEAHLSVFGDE
jgi:hypothetical protein